MIETLPLAEPRIVIRLGRLGADIAQPVAAFRATFAKTKSLYMPDFLAPDLLEVIRAKCNAATFKPIPTEGLGAMEVEWPRRAGLALSLALSRPALMHWLSEATQCGPLARADGRIAQGRAGQHHHLDWHDDQIDPARRLAITINLTETDYEGGLFELRELASGKVLTMHRHIEIGGMLVFQVSPDLQHRIMPISGGGPRRVYTGWFYAPSPTE